MGHRLNIEIYMNNRAAVFLHTRRMIAHRLPGILLYCEGAKEERCFGLD